MNYCDGQGAGQQCQNCPDSCAPHTLHTHNSDGSNPSPPPPFDWLGEAAYWFATVAVLYIGTGLLAFALGYFTQR